MHSCSLTFSMSSYDCAYDSKNVLKQSQKPQPGDKNTSKANKSFSFFELNTHSVFNDYTSVLYSMTKTSPRDLESDHLMAVFVNVWESLISTYNCRYLAAS